MRVKRFIKHNSISNIVINTADNTIIRNLIFFLPLRINYTAIVHDARRLEKSFTFRKIISSRINKFFVLSDYILKNIRTRMFKLQSFYPLYFPGTKTVVNKSPNAFWIGIPGVVSQERRDYKNLFEQLLQKPLASNIKIILAGKFDRNIEPELYQLVISLKDRIIFFEDFVPYEMFHAYIKQCDVLLPLLNIQQYFSMRISGAFNLSFAYHIPLCVQEQMKTNDDINKVSLFYNGQQLAKFISELPAKHQAFEDTKNYMNAALQFNLSYQCNKYLQLVEA